MKKIIALIFVTIFLTSCDEVVLNKENIEQENNLQSNTEHTMNSIQTQKLQDGDVVAIMKTTNGTIKLKLFTDLVPKTTLNFIAHAKSDYYKDVIFHRIIKGFMIQGGDPDGTGMGGVSIYGEKFDDEFTPELTNIKYSISMANSGPNTNGSQFFINEANNNFLDNKHSVFGQVVEGTDTVDKIAKVKTLENDRPEKEIKIISIEIKEYKNGTYKDYEFDLEVKLKEIEEATKKKEEEQRKIEEAKAKESLERQTKPIEAGFIVEVHYTGTFDDGEKFDSSYDREEPIPFQVGAGQMIKGFDDAVVGMKLGEKKTIRLEPSDAYGEAEISIPKADLQSFVDAGVKLEKGEILPTGQGEIEILSADEISIKVENPHPMAGKTLNFDIEIVSIK